MESFRVAELLCYLSFMRTLNDIPVGAAVNWDKAHVQAIRGSLESNAAHALPCQILVSSQYPWFWVKSKYIDQEHLRTSLRQIFGRVWILPKAFNLADCVAEANCLRGALVAACDKVIRDSRKREPSAGRAETRRRTRIWHDPTADHGCRRGRWRRN